MKIKSLFARQILDSRGDPTLDVSIELENGIHASAQVPSGKSKGTYEAHELRDDDPKAYDGQGVLKACHNVSIIFDRIKDIPVEQQREIDLAMIDLDGTENKSKLGANAMLGVSFACMKAAAYTHNKEPFEQINAIFNEYFHTDTKINIPCPLFNIINGGQHAHNRLDFQEFMIIPCPYQDMLDIIENHQQKRCHAKKALQMGAEILHTLSDDLIHEGYETGIGDEGGNSIDISHAKTALNLLCEAVMHRGYKLYDEVSFGIDCASNYFYDKDNHTYVIDKHDKAGNFFVYDSMKLKDFYAFFLTHYPIIYLEDYFEEEAWDDFAMLTTDTSLPHIGYSGDDLVVTNTKRLEKAVSHKSINTMIVKPNQIGTLYETFHVVAMCIKDNILYVPSHRSGETNDEFITDIAVGLGASFLKAGAPQRGERVSKYNRLLAIEESLGYA